MRGSLYTPASVESSESALSKHVLDRIVVEVEDAAGIVEGYSTAIDFYSSRDDAESFLLRVLASEGVTARPFSELEHEALPA